VKEILIINRSAQAATVAAELAQMARVASMEEIPEADIVVNATSVGMATGQADRPAGTADTPVPATLLRPHHVVTDLVYHPLETRLLTEAREIGAQVVDGLGMLIHQAALQQRLWTGAEPDLAAMRLAAETELAARRR
jgi:shikimate dehydrogenase